MELEGAFAKQHEVSGRMRGGGSVSVGLGGSRTLYLNTV